MNIKEYVNLLEIGLFFFWLDSVFWVFVWLVIEEEDVFFIIFYREIIL